MKQFIVLAAVLPILMLFLAQFMLDGQRQVRMSAAEDAVRTFCLEGSYYGRIGAGEADVLRSRLAGIFGTSPADVTVELAPAREGVLSYRIAFPVGKIMAGAALMGIPQNRNKGRAELTGEIVLPPPDLSADKPQEDTDKTQDNTDEAADDTTDDTEEAQIFQ